MQLQNGHSDVIPLLNQQLQTDILVELNAAPTAQANIGPAVRILAQAVSTTDARVLGTSSTDLLLPMDKHRITECTGYLAKRLMQRITRIWNGYSPIIVRIYNAGSVGDVLKIRKLIESVAGVRRVDNRGITGSSTTAYGRLAVLYGGSPVRFYSSLKREINNSTGLEATDLQNNTVDMQITGPIVIHPLR